MKIGIRGGVIVVLALSVPTLAQNTGVRLTDGPAILDYAFAGTGNLPTVPQGSSGNVSMNFQLGGIPGDAAEQQVFSGNWFYRVGGANPDTRERHPANAATKTVTGTNAVEWMFPQVFTTPAGGGNPTAIPGVSARMAFDVHSTGPDSAYFMTYFCVDNFGSETFPIDVFFALDMDLAATTFGDVYGPLVIGSPGRTWNITDGPFWNGIISAPGATRAAAGPQASIMGAMTNATPNNFFDTPALGLGGGTDNAAVVEFNLISIPGPSVCSGLPVRVDVSRTPEPASLALLAAGVSMLLKRRGR